MSDNVGVVIPPTTQEAYNIIKGLEGQVGNIASAKYNIEMPFLNEALSIFRSFPDKLNQLFGDTQNSITNRYSNLFNNIKTQMNNQWSQSALNLSAMGMYNTPATQLTQSDIVNKLFGNIAEQETQTLNSLDASKLQSLIEHYSKTPQLLATFGETFAGIDPSINQYQMQLDLAGVLNGLNLALYPKMSPLAQLGNLLGSALMMSKGLSSLGSLFGGSPSSGAIPSSGSGNTGDGNTGDGGDTGGGNTGDGGNTGGGNNGGDYYDGGNTGGGNTGGNYYDGGDTGDDGDYYGGDDGDYYDGGDYFGD